MRKVFFLFLTITLTSTISAACFVTKPTAHCINFGGIDFCSELAQAGPLCTGTYFPPEE